MSKLIFPTATILITILLQHPLQAEARCFRPIVACGNPSRMVCASSSSSSVTIPNDQLTSMYQQMIDTKSIPDEYERNNRIFHVCSWICISNSSCAGFNFQDSGNHSEDYCQLFQDFPKEYTYSNSCSFFTIPSNESGCYSILPDGINNMVLDNSTVTVEVAKNWIVIQRRVNNTPLFDQKWKAYRDGFGNPIGNFWLGLQKIFDLISGESFRVRFEAMAQNGLILMDEYSSFTINDEPGKYAIFVSGYIGYNTDFMNYEVGGLVTAKCNGSPFSTQDADNDVNLFENCALTHSGGWWYHSKCDSTNFNGQYGKYFNHLLRSQQVTALKYCRILVKMN